MDFSLQKSLDLEKKYLKFLSFDQNFISGKFLVKTIIDCTSKGFHLKNKF